MRRTPETGRAGDASRRLIPFSGWMSIFFFFFFRSIKKQKQGLAVPIRFDRQIHYRCGPVPGILLDMFVHVHVYPAWTLEYPEYSQYGCLYSSTGLTVLSPRTDRNVCLSVSNARWHWVCLKSLIGECSVHIVMWMYVQGGSFIYRRIIKEPG